MPALRTTTGLMLVLLLATLGAVLVWLPPWVMEQYERVEKLGGPWLYVYFGLVGSGALLLGGSSAWISWKLWAATRAKRKRHDLLAKNPSELSDDQRRLEIESNLADIAKLQNTPSLANGVRQELDPLVTQFAEKRESQRLEIVAFGTISSGKSSLLNALAGRDVFQTDIQGGTTVSRNEIDWPNLDRVALVDTPGLGEVEGAEHVAISAAAAKDADIVLLVVDGPLRDSEFQLLEQLGRMEKRVLVCLTKEDWYDERERNTLLGQIAEQVHGIVSRDDVVSVQAQTVHRPRVRVLPTGEESHEQVPVHPDISLLAERLMHVVKRDGRDLLMANLLLQSRGLVSEARRRVSESLDRSARGVVDKYTWAAGGAAAVSQLPILDLIAGSAITTKMVVDISRVYNQDMDLAAATELLGHLGKNLLASVGISAATPLAASAAASLLKAVPGAGTIAGGVLQGLVQALVTRWIGLFFIEYFKNESRRTPSGIAELAREQWQKVTSLEELRQLVVTARHKLFSNSESTGK